MTLTSDQLEALRQNLLEQQGKLQGVLGMLDDSDPALDTERVDDNADLQTEAIEDNELVRTESLRRETEIMLDRVKQALHRIAEGSYGKTPDGEEIPFERLQVDPTATTLVHGS